MIYTISEFADFLGVKRQNIRTYGERGKLIIKNGQIDTDDPITASFLENRAFKGLSVKKPLKKKSNKEKSFSTKVSSPIPVIEIQKPKEKLQEPPPSSPPIQKTVNDDDDDDDDNDDDDVKTQDVTSLTAKMNLIKFAKTQEEYKLLKIKTKKAEGELIEIQFVEQFMVEVFKRFRSLIVSSFEEKLREIMQNNNNTNSEIVKAVSDLVTLANQANEKAIQELEIFMKEQCQK